GAVGDLVDGVAEAGHRADAEMRDPGPGRGRLHLSFAKIRSRDWTIAEGHASHGEQCPSYLLCWAPCARRSEPAPTSRSRTWHSGNSSPCSAADRSVRNSGASIASFGCGSRSGGMVGVRRSTSFEPTL